MTPIAKPPMLPPPLALEINAYTLNRPFWVYVCVIEVVVPIAVAPSPKFQVTVSHDCRAYEPVIWKETVLLAKHGLEDPELQPFPLNVRESK